MTATTETGEELRVNLAEKLGAKWIDVPPYEGPLGEDPCRPERVLTFRDELPRVLPISIPGSDSLSPNFPDLASLVRQAEQELSEEQWHMYALILSQRHWQNPDSGWTDWRDTMAMIRLTDEDRARALLEVL